MYLTSNKTNVAFEEGRKAEHKHAVLQGTEDSAGRVMRRSTQGPQPSQEKALVLSVLSSQRQGLMGENKCSQRFWIVANRETVDRASARGAPSSYVFHGPAAPAIPHTMLLTLQQMQHSSAATPH